MRINAVIRLISVLNHPTSQGQHLVSHVSQGLVLLSNQECIALRLECSQSLGNGLNQNGCNALTRLIQNQQISLRHQCSANGQHLLLSPAHLRSGSIKHGFERREQIQDFW